MAQLLGRVGIWLTVAMVAILIIVPAQGLYFVFINETYELFNFDCIALVLIAAWGAWGPQPLLVRFSGSLALASLIVANLAFSAPMFRTLSVQDGLAVGVSFWFMPWLLMWGLRSIPKVGLRLGKLHDQEIRLFQPRLGTADLISTAFLLAVVIYVWAMAFPITVPAAESWMEANHESWSEGLGMGLLMTGLAVLPIWFGLNQRKWVFVILFGGLSLLSLLSLFGTLTQNESSLKLLPFVFVNAAVVCLPLCLRLAGYRVARHNDAVAPATDMEEQGTASGRSWGSVASLSVVAVSSAWLVTSSASGAVARHRFHCAGEFVYGTRYPAYNWGQLQRATVPLAQGEPLLRSSQFRFLPALTLSGSGEIDKGLVEAALSHAQLRELDISNAPISESLFFDLAYGKPWKSLAVRYPPRLAAFADPSNPDPSHNANQTGSIEELSLWVTSPEERDGLTMAAIEQLLEQVRVESIRLEVDPSIFLTANYDLVELVELHSHHPHQRLSACLGKRGERVLMTDGLLRLEKSKLLDEKLAEAILIRTPRVLVVDNCETEFTLPDDSILAMAEVPPVSAEFSAEQRQMLQKLKKATRGVQAVVVSRTPVDDRFLDHFVTADRMELALVVEGRVEPEHVRKIVTRPNVVTLTLNCLELPAETVTALGQAKYLKTVYYGDHLSPEAIEAIRSECPHVEIHPLSTRENIPW